MSTINKLNSWHLSLEHLLKATLSSSLQSLQENLGTEHVPAKRTKCKKRRRFLEMLDVLSNIHSQSKPPPSLDWA